MTIPLSIFNIDLSSGNLILLVSLLMFVAILTAKLGTRFGVPTMLLFLIIGICRFADNKHDMDSDSTSPKSRESL